MGHSAGNTRKGCYANIPSLKKFPSHPKNISKSNTKHPIADNFSKSSKLGPGNCLIYHFRPNHEKKAKNFAPNASVDKSAKNFEKSA